MPHLHQEYHHLYQKKIFWWTFLTFLLIGLVGGVILYLVQSNQLFRETQETLRKIAQQAVAVVPPDRHEQLTEPAQEESELYTTIADDLRLLMRGNPNIDDIYTLRPTPKPHEFTFVVSAKETRDENRNGVIGIDEEKAHLGERYSTADFPELEAGLKNASVDAEITYDKWGAWLSGYAPIRDERGRAVAVLGVDYAASVIAEQRADLFRLTVYANLIVVPLFFIAAFLVSLRLSRPIRTLAEGMDRVAHGDTRYRLPFHGRGEEAVLAQLFNNILSLFNSNERPRQPGTDESSEPPS